MGGVIPRPEAMRPCAKIDGSPATQSYRGAYFRSISLSGSDQILDRPCLDYIVAHGTLGGLPATGFVAH